MRVKRRLKLRKEIKEAILCLLVGCVIGLIIYGISAWRFDGFYKCLEDERNSINYCVSHAQYYK